MTSFLGYEHELPPWAKKMAKGSEKNKWQSMHSKCVRHDASSTTTEQITPIHGTNTHRAFPEGAMQTKYKFVLYERFVVL